MKTLIIKLGIAFLRLIYFFMKLFPQKKRIVMLSRESDTVPLDFRLLKDELQKQLPEYETVTLCKLLSSKDVSFLKTVVFTFKSMVLLSTASYCIVDTYNVAVSVLKHRKGLTVMQIWHALGGLKKFGLMSLGTEDGQSEETARLLCMHKNYDVITAPSETARGLYSKAFGCTKEKIFVLGMPRVDYILDGGEEKKRCTREITKEFPAVLNGKKNILYAPTFRADGRFFLDEILKTVDFSKYNLIVKIHDVDKKHELPENVINIDRCVFDIFPLADFIVTDYSACAAEAALTNKPLFFYTYDIEDYETERGLYFNPQKELPEIAFKSFGDIYAVMENGNYPFEAQKRFLNISVLNADTNNTKRIVKKLQENLI